MDNEKSGIAVLPPIIFALALMVAFVTEWFLPLPILPNLLQYALGVFIVACSFLLIPSIFNKFRAANTTLDVRKIPSSLLTDGAFAFSRDPIYVSMIRLCFGIGVLFDNIWVLPTLYLAVIYLTYKIILIEEALLEQKFGQDYMNYKQRVRRWF